MSFGSWVAMTAGAEDPRVSLLLGIAPPVDRYDFDVLRTCTLPKFIIHGEEDELISIKEIRKFYAQIPEPKELVTIEDANHLFEGKTSLVGEAVEDLLADFNTVRHVEAGLDPPGEHTCKTQSSFPPCAPPSARRPRAR